MLMHVPTAIIALIDWSRRVPGQEEFQVQEVQVLQQSCFLMFMDFALVFRDINILIKSTLNYLNKQFSSGCSKVY